MKMPVEKEWFEKRAAFILYRGGIPPGLHILHKCDVRECVNPDHLYAGTNRQNMDDRNRRSIGKIGRPRKPQKL